MHLSDKNASILIAGATGMVGAATVRALRDAGYSGVLTPSRDDLDLTDAAATRDFFARVRPDFVVLAAARVGGIAANDRYPVPFLADNLAIALHVIRAAYEAGVQRLIFLGSSCIYPKRAPQPLREASLLTGPLEPTNQWYAVAKIAGLKLCQAYRRQHGADFVSLMPTNLYGPGDNFDLETSHVLPALLRKVHEARRTGLPDAEVTLWGTGTPRREFLHVDDLADAIRFILEEPEASLWQAAPDGLLNVGTGRDLPIRELLSQVQDVVGHEGPVRLDRARPDGTPRKLLDVSRLQALGWTAQTPLRDGLRQTYCWYLDHEAVPARA